MEKCDFCIYRDSCIGDVPGLDGSCLGFAVPLELQDAYQAFLSESKKSSFDFDDTMIEE